MSTKRIGVLGLGNMGRVIARLYLQEGYDVTVWNRSPAPCKSLADGGASVAESPADLFQCSDVIICIVNSSETLTRIFHEIGDGLFGKIIMNFVSGLPADAAGFQTLVLASGGFYTDGVLFCFPRQLGSPEASIMCAASPSCWEQTSSFVSVLAAQVVYTGHQICQPKVAEAIISGSYTASILTYLKALDYGKSYGLDEGFFIPFFEPTGHAFAAQLTLYAKERMEERFDTSEATLQIFANSTDLFNTAMSDAGVISPYMEAASHALNNALNEGLGALSISAIK